jgi:hypothetical protein
MKSFTLLAILLAVTTLSTAQTREIYTNANFKTLAKDHKVLAVLSFKTTLQLRPKEVEKNGGPAGVAALEKTGGTRRTERCSFVLPETQGKSGSNRRRTGCQPD